jgi:hypothetical protein
MVMVMVVVLLVVVWCGEMWCDGDGVTVLSCECLVTPRLDGL